MSAIQTSVVEKAQTDFRILREQFFSHGCHGEWFGEPDLESHPPSGAVQDGYPGLGKEPVSF